MTGVGTLYGVGVGPGDPDLITLKAARIIREAPVIAVPVTQPGGESYALSIAAGLVWPDQTVLRLHFPMTRDVVARIAKREAAAAQIAENLRAGRDVAFLTEGDPTLHSTFGYVLEHLPGEFPVAVVPGVTSVTAGAADAAQPLVRAGERLAVLPATFEEIDALELILRDFDTVVLMKVHSVLDAVVDLLDGLGIAGQAVVVERASHPAGRVHRDVLALRGQPIHYLSLMIIYSRRLARERVVQGFEG
jgi:precorrin-2/cobalt-factor-2 C20-methyltransferase